MSRSVFILGAGASVEAGAPLMANFLDNADELRQRERIALGPAAADFDLVFKALATLQAVHSKADLDIQNIESVFAAFEMADLFGAHLRDLTGDEVRGLGRAIRSLIVNTLESRITYPVREKHAAPPPPYQEFVKLLFDMRSAGQTVSVLTFNYDVALDYALHANSVSANYGLGTDTRSDGVPLLKLHGSLNWAKCNKCGVIVPWQLHEFFAVHRWDIWFHEPKQCRLDLSKKMTVFTHCSEPVVPEPVIVPPTWNKTAYYSEIAAVWKEAARHLSEAENIFVFGYSLPPSDHFFRYLFALGTVSDTIMKRFWVFDPDPSGEVRTRFEGLLGQAVRNRFRFGKVRFANAIAEVRSSLAIVPHD